MGQDINNKLNKKKIVIFMPSIEFGGVEKNLKVITDYLSKKLNNIILITANNNVKTEFNKKIIYVSPKYKFVNNLGRRFKTLICLFLLFKIYFKEKNIVILSFQANNFAIIFSYLFNIPILTRSNTAPIGWSNNIFKKIIFKILLKIPKCVIVNSKEFKKKIDKEFNIKSKLIYNPFVKINKKLILKKKNIKFLNSKSLKIINVGRLVDQKDHFTLLKAFHLVTKKIDAKLLIIGSGKNKEKLEKFIKDHSLNKIVKIINFQKNPFNFIHRADLFVLTSKFEGLPNVLIESQYLKKYVISTDCPTGPKEILLNGKLGDLVKVGDYNKISYKIIEFYKKKNEMRKKIKLAKKSLYRFDYKNNCNEYLKILEKYI